MVPIIAHELNVTTYRCYATAIRASGLQFDVLFGPAYKGISLATAVAIACAESDPPSDGSASGDKEVCFNRKEAKTHGEVVPNCDCSRLFGY